MAVDIDIEMLISQSHGFTPADLFLAAERAAFAGFARSPTGSAPQR
jgi:hypothetical protein